MHPILSIGIYTLLQAFTLFLIRWCLGKLQADKKEEEKSRIPRSVRAGGTAAYVLLAALPVGGALLKDSGIKFVLQAAGNVFLGFFVYFGGLLFLLCLLAAAAARLTGRHVSTGCRSAILALSAAAGLVLPVYGMIHAQHTIVTEHEIRIEKDADGLQEMKIALIADLHLSVNSRLDTIRKMTEKINEAQPDVVVVAGDIFTSSYDGLRHPEKYAEVLRSIRAPEGVYAVYGNHDVEETLFGGFPISPISEAFRTKEMEQFFTDCGFTILYDETVTFADGRVQLTGRVDGEKAGDGTALRKSPAEVLADIDPEKPVIVLEHEPVEFGELKAAGADLALCGHTHAGQFFPGSFFTRFFFKNHYGYRKVDGLDTFVTSGIGYYGPPMRVGTDSEIMILHVLFGEA